MEGWPSGWRRTFGLRVSDYSGLGFESLTFRFLVGATKIMKYSIEKIAWIDCIFAPMNDANSVTIQIMCKAWSMYETIEQGGIAHCLEHMFFKWWDRYKNQKEVSETLDSIWADYNASTSNNLVEYHIKCAPEFVEHAIDVLADMMMNAKFDENELEKEKWVIIQEMKMYEDDPMSLVAEKQRLWFLGDNSLGRRVIWSEETVMSFSGSDLKSYKTSLYTKDNLIISVAWKILDIDKIKKLIENHFSSMWEKKTIESPIFPGIFPSEHESFFKKWTEQNHLIINALWFTWWDEKRVAARVLASILWGNMSSRLFQNIRTKEGLCYYISWYHLAWPDVWFFWVRAWMDKDRFEFGLQRIREEIDNYAKNWATQEEFEKAIWYLQWQIQMWIETSDEMAYFLWSQYIIYDKIETLEEILQKYKNLTLKDVNQLSSMLSIENCYTYHIE